MTGRYSIIDSEMQVDLYRTLNVGNDAKPEEIKRQFRKMANKNHPDKGGDPEQFRRVKVAYDILSHPLKRARYDRTGEVDDGAETNGISAAGQTLVHLFDEMVSKVPGNSLVYEDLMDRLKELVGHKIAECRTNHAKTVKQIRLSLILKKRLKKKAGEYPPVLINNIEEKWKAMIRSLVEINKRVEVLKLAAVMVDEYEFLHDEKPQRSYTVSFDYGTTTSY